MNNPPKRINQSKSFNTNSSEENKNFNKKWHNKKRYYNKHNNSNQFQNKHNSKRESHIKGVESHPYSKREAHIKR